MQRNLEIYKKSILQFLKRKEREENFPNGCTQEESSDLIRDFECPVCFTMMVHVEIFGCSNDHFLCPSCVAKVTKCPMCDEDFSVEKPTRRFMQERIAPLIVPADVEAE